MDAAGLSALEEVIEQTSRAGVPTGLPHIGTMMQSCSRIFGGPDGIASKLYLEYLNSKPGGQGRQRILLRLMEFAMETSKQGYAKVPFDLLDDGDLEQEVAQLVNRVANDDPALLARIMVTTQEAESDASAIEGEVL